MNWSFSKLMTWEKCPRRFKYQYIDKAPQLPRDEATDPLERGSRIHKEIEQAIKENARIPKEARDFTEQILYAQELYVAGNATAEDDWIFNDAWERIEKSGAVWLWSKLDLNVTDDKRAVVVDYKTGKSKYKMLEHIQQGQLYAALTALIYPDVEIIVVEFWYIDEGWIKDFTYTREQALAFIGLFQRRVDRMYADKFFPPRPNVMSCSWCPYGHKNGTGLCPVSAGKK